MQNGTKREGERERERVFNPSSWPIVRSDPLEPHLNPSKYPNLANIADLADHHHIPSSRPRRPCQLFMSICQSTAAQRCFIDRRMLGPSRHHPVINPRPLPPTCFLLLWHGHQFVFPTLLSISVLSFEMVMLGIRCQDWLYLDGYRN